MVAATIASYTWFTVTTTSWRYVQAFSCREAHIKPVFQLRTRFRREANKADNRSATVIVDSLINYEAVKVSIWLSLFVSWTYVSLQNFNNEKFEIARLDKHLSAYEKASIKITTSLAFLNAGQGVIFSTALTSMMFLAAQGVVNGLWIPQKCLVFQLTSLRHDDTRGHCHGQSTTISVVDTIELLGNDLPWNEAKSPGYGNPI